MKTLTVNGKAISQEDMERYEKENEELKDKYPELRELEEVDKKLRHKPITLYCLGCGEIISKDFTGGLWSYTHPCNYKDTNKKPVTCVVFGSKERGVMTPSSMVCGYKSFVKCKECKDEIEHTKKVLEGAFGKGWQNNKMPNEEIEKLRILAVLKVTAYASEKYGQGVKDYQEKWK